MNGILGILLISTVVIFAFMIFATWFMNNFLRFYIGRKHFALEEIVEMKKIPVQWSKKFEKQMARTRDDEEISRIRERAAAYYLRKLKYLEGYVKRSTLVQGEETRQILLESIESLSSEWGNTNHAFRFRTAHAEGKG